ncbi:hypothetical protein [Mucilaginibacter sp. 22184]|uniref:hypothetical protein n=1 Tax=Mucilaginibacter sp. 22184 TaxID=3453887 RepID=UPI003F844372
MAIIKVLITFSGTATGSVHCQILGAHTNLQFDVTAQDEPMAHPFNLRPNVYSVQVSGSSGGKVSLLVAQEEIELVNESDENMNVFILKAFAVN